MDHNSVLNFWFDEIRPSQWWLKDDKFDQQISRRFSDIHSRASRCELFDWRITAEGRLAEVIILDQFSRNMFRGTANSFAFDPLALALSQEAVSQGVDKQLNSAQRQFLYMPYMHSESPVVHQLAIKLFSSIGSHNGLDSERRHKDIIRRFGRYPHRNEILGRVSTRLEVEFLKLPASGF